MSQELENNEGESLDSSVLDSMVSMSDEDFLKMEEPTDEVLPAIVEEEEESDDVEEVETTLPLIKDETETEDKSEPKEVIKPAVEDESDPAIEEDKKQVVDASSSEAFMKAILAPFKANGKEMKVDNVDEARTLMEMGANYNKKMSALKPNLKLMKMLDNNGLLDESKLSYLIDLSKKDPSAISKLIKESGVDPLDIDVNKESDYKPKTYTVSDAQVVLDDVLEDIRDTGSFQTTMDIVNNKWDAASQDTLVRSPNVLKIINEHVASGIYAQINTVVEKERMLGKLVGVSDIEAYKQVGDVMFAQQAKVDTPANVAMSASKNKPVVEDDSKAKARKLAASSPKAKQRTAQVEPDFNPLTVPEDQLDALFAKFL